MFIVSKVIDRLDTLYKFANIRFNAKTQELRYYYTFEGEYDVLGKRADGKVFDTFDIWNKEMKEEINKTKAEIFKELTLYIKEIEGDI